MARRSDDVAGGGGSSAPAQKSPNFFRAGALSRARLLLIITGSSVGSLTPLFHPTTPALMGHSSMTDVRSHRWGHRWGAAAEVIAAQQGACDTSTELARLDALSCAWRLALATVPGEAAPAVGAAPRGAPSLSESRSPPQSAIALQDREVGCPSDSM